MLRGLSRYVSRRWKGRVSLASLILRDMLILGTLANLAATIASLIALGNGAPTSAGLLIFLLPLPYNLFVFGCVWREAGRIGGWKGNLACVFAAFWLIAAILM